MRVRVFPPPFADPAPLDEGGMVELPEGAKLGGLLRLLKVPLPAAAVLLFRVNRGSATLDTRLHEGDTVSFLSLPAGG